MNEDDAVLMALQPGEISLHHVLAAHASDPNRSDDRRIGIAVRYVAPHVRQLNGDKDTALLCRGEDKYGNFIHETAAKTDMDEEALAEYDGSWRSGRPFSTRVSKVNPLTCPPDRFRRDGISCCGYARAWAAVIDRRYPVARLPSMTCWFGSEPAASVTPIWKCSKGNSAIRCR